MRADGTEHIQSPKVQRVGSALVLTQTTANQRFVTAACNLAHQSGVRPGMTLAQAKALCPTLQHEEHDPAADVGRVVKLRAYVVLFDAVAINNAEFAKALTGQIVG